MKYAWNVARAVTKARLHGLGVFYDRRFESASASHDEWYQPKLDFQSTHSLVFEMVSPGARVLDLGCAGGYMAAALRTGKHCKVVGVDVHPLPPGIQLDAFHQHDLNEGLPPIDMAQFDVVLLLDVIEHLTRPEEFVQRLREKLKCAPDVSIIVTTGNIAFAVTRAMLMLGQFNYGRRGILDMTHTRLFTFASLRRLFEQNGYRLLQSRGVPAPFPLVLKGWQGRWLLRINEGLIWIWKNLFAYQIMIVVRPLPALEYLLESAETHSAQRAAGQT
jgi:2-polyprenyl-3-methyl-5-hydroxy-6-metoxy-1,4-benzoquinol methylase